MTATLRALRKLLFGDTWVLPVGIAVVLLVGANVASIDDQMWHTAGGGFLLGGVVVVLRLSTRRDGRRP